VSGRQAGRGQRVPGRALRHLHRFSAGIVYPARW